jgi:hypothetical protein
MPKEVEPELTPEEYMGLQPFSEQINECLARVFAGSVSGSMEDLAEAAADLSVLFFVLGKNSVKEG